MSSRLFFLLLSETNLLPQDVSPRNLIFDYSSKILQEFENFVTIFNNNSCFNPLNAELKLICHLLALSGTHRIFHVSGLSVK
jgi:hypothetical protein